MLARAIVSPQFVRGSFVLLAVVVIGTSVRGADADDQAASPQEVFERRIVPIFKSPDPSSCTQCHLAGVDLKNYILPSHEKTFLSLRDQGLIDMEKPEQSKILRLINMRETNQGGAKGRYEKGRNEKGRGDDRRGADLILEKARRAEFEAFAAWIKASAADPKLRAAPKLAKEDLAQPPRPAEVIRHARKDRLLESFEQNIWAMRFRCMSCHIEGTEQNKKLVAEHGQRVAWMKAAGPEATLRYLVGAKGLVNTKEPDKSLLLLKPLHDVENGGVEHGGGKKFLYGDQGYKAFRAWIEDYAKIVGDQYAQAADLPKPASDAKLFGSEIWFKLTGTPDRWGDKLLQVNIYAWDAKAGAWEKEPIATSDRQVAAKPRLWQHTLTLAASRDSELAKRWQREKPALPPGKYLVKVYVDLEGRASKDWQAALGEDEFVGQAEVTSRWPEGYGSMTVLDAGRLKR
jgi:hypothetical protein